MENCVMGKFRPTIMKDLFIDEEQVEAGAFSYGRPLIQGNGPIKIGKFCSFGPDVELLPFGDHRFEWAATYPFNQIGMFEYTKKAEPHRLANSRRFTINIGNDVWLGRKSRILHGSDIRDGAVVGAFTVVAGKVEPYSIVVGNPAKEIHKRFEPEIIEVMLKIKWWDWPLEHIIKNLDILTKPPDVEELEKAWREIENSDSRDTP